MGTIKLYDYQERVLSAIESDPSHSQLISMPTGTGKTITFLSAIKLSSRPTLVLVHRNELLDQTYDKAVQLGFSPEDIAVIRADDKQDIRPLTIAMVPTLIRNLYRYDADSVQMMVIDDAHHATAGSYRTIMDHFRIFEDQKRLLGFTATPVRGDGRALSPIFASHSFKMTLSEATMAGFICPVHGIRIEFDRSLAGIKDRQGDYDISDLDKVMNCPEVNDAVSRRLATNRRWPGIAFCTSVNHAETLADMLVDVGIQAEAISYQTPKKEQGEILTRLRNGETQIVTNAVKLSEGFDFPEIETVVLVRPTRSPVLYKQMIGRGLRKAHGKHECLVLEFAGNDERMINWDDIDENATFQCVNAAKAVSMKEGDAFYRKLYKSPKFKVLGLRQSPFNFYECKVRRVEKYRRLFRYMIYEDGFAVVEFKKKQTPSRQFVHNFYVRNCFWKEPYKTFTLWDEGYLYFSEVGRDIGDLERLVDFYSEKQAGGFGRWYPSEYEPMRPEQVNIIERVLHKKVPPSISARKADMFIEDACVKEAINRYFLKCDPKKQNKREVYDLW